MNKIFGALKEIKFDKVAALELINPEYWKWDAEKVIRVGKDKTETVLKRYFT